MTRIGEFLKIVIWSNKALSFVWRERLQLLHMKFKCLNPTFISSHVSPPNGCKDHQLVVICPNWHASEIQRDCAMLANKHENILNFFMTFEQEAMTNSKNMLLDHFDPLPLLHSLLQVSWSTNIVVSFWETSLLYCIPAILPNVLQQKDWRQKSFFQSTYFFKPHLKQLLSSQVHT